MLNAEIEERRKSAMSRGVGVMTQIFVDKAENAEIWDKEGNRYIDFAAGIAVVNTGHRHPRVIEAVKDQLDHFTHTCHQVVPYENYVRLAERLNSIVPISGEKKSIFVTTGAEAVENAIKIARAHTGRNAVVAVEHAYHGRTNLTMALTAKNMPYKHSFGPFASEVYRVPTSYPLRDELDGPQAAERAIARIEAEVGATNLAAVIIEPIQGEGGFIVPAAGFLPAMAQWCTDNGVVFIADEIQTGFCRTGEWFACDHEGVVPDLITTAKGIAGGMPLAAVTGRAEIMDSVHVGGLGGTYGGNPVACAAALGAIATMEEQDLAGRAQQLGTLMMDRLNALAEKFDVIAQVRGRGAMVAIEFAEPGTLKPLPDLPKALAARCTQEGVVILTAGTFGNVIRLLPPLVISDELLIEGLDVLADALAAELSA